MPKATFITLNELYVLLASADDGKSQLLWPSIIVGIVALLAIVVVMIVIVMKQKWRMRAKSQRNLEVCEGNDYSLLSKLLIANTYKCPRLDASCVTDAGLYDRVTKSPHRKDIFTKNRSPSNGLMDNSTVKCNY